MQSMPESETQIHDAGEQLHEAAPADVVIGLPTYNNRETIAGVIQGVLGGLRSNGHSRPVILNADGGSKDGTPELLAELTNGNTRCIRIRYPIAPVHQLSIPL